MTPDVSVVLPTRNRWALAARAVRLALASRDVAVEVVLIDDGSDTPAPATAPFDDPRVRAIRLDPNQGVARARNAGVDAAAAAWIAFLDDDDLWAPGKLAAQLAAVAGGADLAWTGVAWLNAEGTARAVYEPTPAATLREDLRRMNAIGGPSSVLARRAAVQRAGGFDPSLSVLADWDLWLRLAATGTGAACPGALTGYVVHPGAMHMTDMDIARREFRRLRETRGVTGGYDHDLWTASGYRDAGRRGAAIREFARMGIRHRSPYQLGRAAGLVLGEGALRRARRPRTPPAAPDWVADALVGGVAGQ